MSPTTIAGTFVDVRFSRLPDGWLACGRLYEGVLPGCDTIESRGASRKEAELRCKEMLERRIHALTHGAE